MFLGATPLISFFFYVLVIFICDLGFVFVLLLVFSRLSLIILLVVHGFTQQRVNHSDNEKIMKISTVHKKSRPAIIKVSTCLQENLNHLEENLDASYISIVLNKISTFG